MAALLGFYALMVGFIKDLWRMLQDPRYRALFFALGILLLVGFFFYRYVEGWDWLDSFYFSVITLTTIGYGDFSPTTPASKIFTIVYSILGLTMFATFLKLVSESHHQRLSDRRGSHADTEDEASPEGKQNDSV